MVLSYALVEQRTKPRLKDSKHRAQYQPESAAEVVEQEISFWCDKSERSYWPDISQSNSTSEHQQFKKKSAAKISMPCSQSHQLSVIAKLRNYRV